MDFREDGVVTFRRRVLVTGAEGTVGGIVRRHLAARFELSYLTRRPASFRSHVADIGDIVALAPAFRGIDSVVHLAASSQVEAGWAEVLHNNVIGAYNVFEAARLAGVRRIVFASSNHAVGMYEVEGAPEIYDLEDGRAYDERADVRPDSLYGVSKVFGEALGRLYADRHGISVICLRLGSVREARPREPGDSAGVGSVPVPQEGDSAERLRATWLSHRDCAQLISRALEADVRWAVAYGISANPRAFWDLTAARSLLGYEPEDAAR